MEQKKIDRINELAKIALERALTVEEEKERHVLRSEYIQSMRNSLTSHLENTYVVDEGGNKKKLHRNKKNDNEK